MKSGSTAVEAAPAGGGGAGPGGGVVGPRFCPRRKERERERERLFAPGVAALSAKFNALSVGAAPALAPAAAPAATAAAGPASSAVRAAVRIFEQQQQQQQKAAQPQEQKTRQAPGRNGLVLPLSPTAAPAPHSGAELLRVIASLKATARTAPALLHGAAPAAPAAGSITGRRRVRPRLEAAAKSVSPMKTVTKILVTNEKKSILDVPEIPHGCETVPNGGYLGRKEMFSLLTQSEGKSKSKELSDAKNQSQNAMNGKDYTNNGSDVSTPTTNEKSPETVNIPEKTVVHTGKNYQCATNDNTCQERKKNVSITNIMEMSSVTLTTIEVNSGPSNLDVEAISESPTSSVNNISGVGSKPVRSPTYVRTVARPLPGSRLSIAGTVSPLPSMEDQELFVGVAAEVKPNESFLWRSSQSTKIILTGNSGDKTVMNDDKQIIDDQRKEKSEELLYDDVGRPYSPIYDDVGPRHSCGAESDDGSETGGSGYEECCMDKGQMHEKKANLVEEDIYDDVDVCTLTAPSDFECYESICGGSSCDQSNSLYGVASTIVAEDSSGSGCSHVTPCSETSDEWVDLDQSDCDTPASTPTSQLINEKIKTRRSPSWSHQVRRTWSRSQSQTRNSQEQKVASDGGEENSSGSDTDHHYEMLEDIVAKNNLNNNDIPFDEFDSFDSDESDETYIKSLEKLEANGISRRLPAPPPQQNVYGITKIAEAAGKKMLKLRKSFGRMKSAKRNANQLSLSGGTMDIVPSVTTTTGTPAEPAAVTAPPLPPLESRLQQDANHVETGVHGPTRGRRYWSLRKFRRATSVVSASHASAAASVLDSRKTSSTFYLATGEAPNKEEISSSGKEEQQSVAKSNRRASSPILPSQHQASSSVLRPSEPPPLPPTTTYSTAPTAVPRRPNKKEKKEKSGSTSWYAECGLFDRTSQEEKSAYKRPATVATVESGSNWYAEAGLWGSPTSSANNSDLSEQDNSGQGTISSAVETEPDCVSAENGEELQTCFKDEPLYQFYNADAVERYMRGGSEMDSDGYEEVGQGQNHESTIPSTVIKRPSAMELIRPHEGQRTLWCQIPEVVNSAVLSTLSSQQKRLQEAKFEIITSEASYMNSLNVLENHFMSSPELCDETVLSKNERRILFGNVMPVKTCSEKLLSELERCWQEDVLLHGICDIIYRHATGHFNIYIKYCSNQIHLDRTLRTLREQHGKFAESLKKLELSPGCQMLSLHSFLMLPMQRITRLPLLVDAVLAKLDPEDSEHRSCEMALAALNKVVHECNEGARRMERMEEILILSRQLEFARDIKPVPIISSARWLVRSGEVTQLVWRGDEKLTFGKRLGKVTLHLFLFTDLLVVTKKKSEESYTVLDYCPRNLVQMASAETVSHLPVKYNIDAGRNLLLLSMLQNHENKTTELVLSCNLESDRQRWLEAVAEPQSDNPDETVYEEWDCPQVRAIHQYVAGQPDELSLDVADVVNVLRKVADGWYQGERIRDGERGWFPANHTVEIASAHIRAKNLKQRYRLLALSANFLETQRKQK